MNFHGDGDVVDRYPVDDRINDDSSHKSHGEDDENPHLLRMHFLLMTMLQSLIATMGLINGC